MSVIGRNLNDHNEKAWLLVALEMYFFCAHRLVYLDTPRLAEVLEEFLQRPESVDGYQDYLQAMEKEAEEWEKASETAAQEEHPEHLFHDLIEVLDDKQEQEPFLVDEKDLHSSDEEPWVHPFLIDLDRII